MASPRPDVLARADRILAPATWVAAAVAVLALLAGPSLIGADKPTAKAPAAQAAARSGREVFESSGCGGCHTLARAGAKGTSGPNLDELEPSAATVAATVKSGAGIMPSFEDRLSAAEIRAVADFVAGVEPARVTPTPTPSARVTTTVRAGRGPDGITADGGHVWVTDARAGTLRRLDARDASPAGSPVAVGSQPDSPAVVAGAVWATLSGEDAVVRVLDGAVRRIPVGRAPEALAAGERFVWVTNAGDGTVTRIRLGSGQVTGAPIPVGGRPLDIALGERSAWVTSFADDTVTRLDLASGKVQGAAIAVGRHPRGVAVGEGSVWVANAGDGTVTRIDPATGRVLGTTPVGRNPREVAVGEGSVWVANAADDTVTRIDPSSGKVVGAPIAVGRDPIGIAVGGGAVWTANFRAGTVTRIAP